LSIVEIKGGPITYRYLEKKAKSEIIRRYLDHIDAYTRLYNRCKSLEKELALLRRHLQGKRPLTPQSAAELKALAEGGRD